MSFGAGDRPRGVRTFVLLHGAGSDSWYWHLVTPRLVGAGHRAIAVDLPVDDERAGLDDYCRVVRDRMRGCDDVILVAQSLAGFVAPVVAEGTPSVRMIVLVAAMTPARGETLGEWWDNTGQAAAAREYAVREGRDPDAAFDPVEIFLHDVPEDVARESAAHVRSQASGIFGSRYPLPEWPDVPTTFVLGRRDRLFPAPLQRRLARERLGVVPVEFDCGHLVALSRPVELADLLLERADEIAAQQIGCTH